MPDPNDWNMQISRSSARTTEGRRDVEGSTLLLLSTTARGVDGTGRIRSLHADGDRLVVFASKAGEPTNPDCTTT